jgi:hypothetical protein
LTVVEPTTIAFSPSTLDADACFFLGGFFGACQLILPGGVLICDDTIDGRLDQVGGGLIALFLEYVVTDGTGDVEGATGRITVTTAPFMIGDPTSGEISGAIELPGV